MSNAINESIAMVVDEEGISYEEAVMILAFICQETGELGVFMEWFNASCKANYIDLELETYH